VCSCTLYILCRCVSASAFPHKLTGLYLTCNLLLVICINFLGWMNMVVYLLSQSPVFLLLTPVPRIFSPHRLPPPRKMRGSLHRYNPCQHSSSNKQCLSKLHPSAPPTFPMTSFKHHNYGAFSNCFSSLSGRTPLHCNSLTLPRL
jgi:hypothetical protein